MVNTADVVILIIVLIVDIVNGIIREGIVLGFNTTTRNKLGEAIATIVTSSFMLLVIIVAIIIYLIIAIMVKKSLVFCTFGVLQFFGVLLYFVGSNIDYIVITYGDVLGCTNACSDYVQYTATFLLGTAVLLYSTISSEFNDNDNDDNDDDGIPLSGFYGPLITVVKLALVYKAVANGIDATGVCSETTVIVTSLFLGLCTLVGTVLIAIYTFKLNHEPGSDKSDDIVFIMTCLPFNIIIAVFYFVPFLLANDVVPLQCVFRCGNNTILSTFNLIEYDPDNGTSFMNQTECVTTAIRNNSGTRLGLFLWCLVMYTLLICQWCRLVFKL